MKAANPLYAQYLTLKDTYYWNGSGLKNVDLRYYVPDQSPISFNPPVYAFDPVSNPAPTYCAPSGDPVYPNGCSSESEMVANLIASEKAILGATTAAASYSGSYFEPFSLTHAAGVVNGVPYVSA